MVSAGVAKGIERLLGELNDDNISTVDIDLIEPDPSQPRKHIDSATLKQLSESIKAHGVLQPIIVNKKDDGRYIIIAGERRWRASKEAKMPTIPAKIVDYSNEKTLQISLIENIQRENLNPLDIALALSTLLKQFNKTQEEVAQEIAKSRSYVTNVLRLLNLPEKVQDEIKKGKISLGHAKVLASCPNSEEFLYEILEKNLSVRETEEKASQYKKKEKVESESDTDIAYIQDTIQLKLGLNAKVAISGKGAGKIVLKVQNMEELDRFLNTLQKFD